MTKILNNSCIQSAEVHFLGARGLTGMPIRKGVVFGTSGTEQIPTLGDGSSTGEGISYLSSGDKRQLPISKRVKTILTQRTNDPVIQATNTTSSTLRIVFL